MKKRFFASVLSLVMLLSLLPTAAFAADDSNTTLPEAVNGVITLENDLVLSSTWIIDNTVTLNLNGHTISSGENTLWGDNTWSLISVRQGGNLTINGDGTLKTIENDCYAVDVQGGATCTINGGNYIGNIHAVYVHDGTLNVTGGEFSIQQTYPNDTNKPYEFTLNCLDANRKAGTAKINVSGGRFFKFDPANNQAEGANTNFTQEGYVSVAEGEYFTVKPLSEVAVAKISNTYYETLAEAYAAVPANSDTPTEIDLLKDCSGPGIGSDGDAAKNYIIDFNNHTYTVVPSLVGSTGYESQALRVIAGQKVELKNGTLASKDALMMIHVYGDLKLDSMVIDGANMPINASGAYTVSYCSGTSVITGDTQIIAKAGGKAFDVDGNYNGKTKTVNVTIDENFTGVIDGTIEYAHGTGSNANLTIKAGCFSNNSFNLIGVDQGKKAQIAISGGYFTSDPSDYLAENHRITSSDKENYAYKVIVAEKPMVDNVVPSVGKTDVTIPTDANIPDGKEDDVKTSAASTTATGLEGQATDLAAKVTDTDKSNGNTALTNAGVDIENQTVTIHAQTYLAVTPTAYSTGTDNTLTLDITAMSRLVAATTGDPNSIRLEKGSGDEAQNAAVILGTDKELTNITTPVTISIQLPSDFVENANTPVYVQHKGYEYTATVTSTTVDSTATYTATFVNPHGFSEFTISTKSIAVAKINDTSYTTLQAAVDAVENGETITLLADGQTAEVSRTVTFKVANTGSNNFSAKITGGSRTTVNSETKDDVTTYTCTRFSSGSGSGTTTYAITTNSPANGTVTASPKSAAKGATVTLTVAPTEGYQLDKLTVADKDGKEITLTDKGNGKYTFTMPASKVEVTATFKQAPVTHVCPAEKYTDVDTTQWYHEGVDYVIANGMMNGTGTNIFEPNATTTRGMIVTILYRLEKEPAAGTSPFTDVDAGQWYAKAVAWAAANGVVNGTSPTTFNPNDPITREQMAAILYRYASFKGYDVTGKADLAGYTDASQISAYAKDAMSWANKAGLIGGVSATTLQPQGSATRAQVATILMRFCENVAK